MGGAGCDQLALVVAVRPRRAHQAVGRPACHPRDRVDRPVPVGGSHRCSRRTAASGTHLSRQPRGRRSSVAARNVRRRSAPHVDRTRAGRVSRRSEDPLDPRPGAGCLQGSAPVRAADGVPRVDSHRRGGHRLDHGRVERAVQPPRAPMGTRARGGRGSRSGATAGPASVLEHRRRVAPVPGPALRVGRDDSGCRRRR